MPWLKESRFNRVRCSSGNKAREDLDLGFIAREGMGVCWMCGLRAARGVGCASMSGRKEVNKLYLILIARAEGVYKTWR